MIADALTELGACPEAVRWVGRRRSWRRAWEQCPRGDWLQWYARRAGTDGRDVVRADAACARLVLHLVSEGEGRPLRAVEAAEAWADDPTLARADAARAAARAAAEADMHRQCADAVRRVIPFPGAP